MPLVVTGIAQNGDISGLEGALRDAGLPLDPIQVIGADESDANLADVDSAQRRDSEIMLGGGQGTGVPGISGGSRDYELPHSQNVYFRNEELWDRLGDLEIPDDEIENYLEALSAGRSVVAYFAGKPDAVAKVEQIFRSSGLAKVKTY